MVVGAVVRRVGVSSITLMSTLAVGAAVDASPVAAAGFACTAKGPAYSVSSGDSWFSIAEQVGVATSALLGANGAESGSRLVPGDELCLPAGADVTAACSKNHTVAAGDSWSSIAQHAGVAVADVLGANGAGVDRVLHPGEVVCLPAGSTTTTSTRTASTRTATTTASTAQPAKTGASYTVTKGDSWFDIAARSGVTLGKLLDANGASADDVLVPGDTIVLPAGATAPAASKASSGGGAVLEALPLQGPCWYYDTWSDPRGGGRKHEGVDIITFAGKYVYAVADGKLTQRAWDQPGRIAGNAWWLTAPDGTYFYYAHMAGFAPGLKVGSQVKAGEIIGWVGATGNASTPHLHFEYHPDGGPATNPYPLIDTAHGCNRGAPYTQPSGWTPD